MHSGRLWSPEGHSFQPHDANWWNLLVRRAEGFGRQYTLANQLDVALQRLRGTGEGAATTNATSIAGAFGDAASSPTDAVGRAAKPHGPNLLLEHFRTHKYRYGAKTPLPAMKSAACAKTSSIPSTL